MKKILTIDGGGIRGVLPARILHEIEKRTKRPISEIFDLIAGTSTGGILALCLTKPDAKGGPRFKALDILKLYEEEGKKIFKKSPWKSTMSIGSLIDEKFSVTGIEEVLEIYLGETKLSEALTDVIIPSYEIEQRIPFFFKSRKAKDSADYDFKMKEVARATSAAPTYFESMKLKASPPVDYFALIDGGVYANNPSMCAYAEAKKVYGDKEDILLVSLGTGELTRRISYEESKNWGLIGWARPLLDVVFDGVSRTVEYQLSQILNHDESDRKFFRFQTKLETGSDNMDDASATNIRVLKLKAEEMINKSKDDIEELCKML
ncbi:MAG TPA: CBASS cGAMP-activated phospholipase [Ignavibacteria bacterium]|nr:CBASS cGAMP-activated phospholipase [Ignavibacteria bacterium]HRJ99014.1 CBASS cGAMP-activated phospholipase [Ignavibacteria bacterium]